MSLDLATVRLAARGNPVAELHAVSGCDGGGRLDTPHLVGDPTVTATARGTEITWRARGELWAEATYRFTFLEEGVLYGYTVRGQGAIDRARFFCRAGSFSPALFRTLWNPEPNSLQRQRFEPGERALIGVTSDKSYYEGNWFFTPGPLCFAVEAGSSSWLALGITARPDEMDFTDLEALEGDGLGLALRYDGHAIVEDSWDSPEVVLLPANDEYGALRAYCRWLRDRGLAPVPRSEPDPEWRAQPIFCGWGEQCALADPVSAGQTLTLAAPAQCTQPNYEGFLSALERRGIEPGTVVVDDKWQRTYGTNEPDPAKWPDLAGFIAAQHARGRRVLLWLKAWDPEGLPTEECILDSKGVPLAADPTTAAYAARVHRTARSLLGDLGADGFKLDFTHAIPSGPAVRSAGGAWGLALMRRLVVLHRTAMHEVSPGAMLMAHTANPAFADSVDVLRLNDVPRCPGHPKSYVAAMRHRARVARAAGSWLIDTDNWPSPDRGSFLEYVREQPSLGIPSLYYVSRIRWRTKGEDWVDEPLRAEDYAEIRGTWERYRQGLAAAPREGGVL